MKISIGIGTITLLLVILKLANVINIGWLWVFAPIWIPLALMAAITAIVILIVVLMAILWILFGDD